MKILILNWRDAKHPRAGGADFRLQHVYAPLTKQGHEVVLYCCAFPGCEPEENIDGIQVHRLGNDFTFSFLCMLKLRGWVKKYKPDVVVEDFNKLPFYSPLVYKGPLVIQMHHLWRSSIFRETNFPMAFFIWLSEEMIRVVYRKCRFSVVSESTRDELVQMKVPEEHVRVIYNGADLSRYQPSDEPKKPFMIWIGRIQKYKGPIDACQVLEKLQNEFQSLELVIVGDGPFRPQLERYITEHGLQHKVRLTGFIDGAEKIKLLQQASVHLQSSYKEGWGLSVIEANACGCPVVANNTTGLCDSVVNGKTGLLYDFCSVEDAASKVRKILTDSRLARSLSVEGLKRASEFSWVRNSEEMIQYLEESCR
ncbi:glycosyltransferase family 4 protein [Pontiellaceae bacterium B12219]|nr:glycosyltransferase family 4 protein [Pontiellaceae bacterium B12219]